jgi:hypothetical protein
MATVLAVRACVRLFFLWIMIWAGIAVALRALFRIDPLLLLWGALGLIAMALAGTIVSFRKTPASVAIRAVLDRHGNFGGLLMAAGDGDIDIGRWRMQMRDVPLPSLRWRSGRSWLLLLSSVGFLAAALLAPDRCLPVGRSSSLQIGGDIQKLTEEIRLLKQEQILPPEKAKILEKDLGRVQQEAQGDDPAKTMEALDHLEQSLSKAASDAAQSAISQTESAARMQELASALQAAKDQMDPRQFGEAMKELANLAQQAAEENESLAGALSDELREALEQNRLTQQQLEELAKALKECKACERGKLVKLIDAKLVDADRLILCDKAGECDEKDLIAVLCKCKSDKELSACLSCNLPGRGGVSRGRGDAAMTWRSGVQKEDAAFKEQVLPPAAVSALKKSRLAGVSASDPTSAKSTGGSLGGALDAAQAGGGEARSQMILPEHEKAVQRYFQREKK